MSITDAQAKNLRMKTVAIAIQEFKMGGYRDTRHGRKGEVEQDHVYDRAYIGGIDNKSIYLSKECGAPEAIGGAWCKQFITKVVMPKVIKELPYGDGGKVARWQNGYAKPDNLEGPNYDFPVKGMVYYRKPDGSDGSHSGHVGIVISVNYKTGEIWTIEGNASESVARRSYAAGKLRSQGAYFYRIWQESEKSLIESAGGQGNVDSFRNAYKKSKDGSSSNETPGGKKSFGNSKVPDDADPNGYSSSGGGVKEAFEIPYMTIAEATDYLKNIVNINKKENDASKEGSLKKDEIVVENVSENTKAVS